PRKPPTPDRDWNKTLPAVQGSAQSWISELAKQDDARSSFNKLLDTPIEFFNFIMNRLGVDTLTPELLAGPTYELMRGSCQQYPHNLLQPLPLIPDNQGRRVILFAHFINNDLEYLRGGASSRKYTTSVTKTKAADYGHIKWIEDLVPRTMWIQEPLNYDKDAFWGVSHWGQKQPKTYKEALTQSCWIEAMQEELHEFERLKVWELVPRPDKVMVITLKWIYKVKLDELGGILKNKARLVARGYHQEEGINFEEYF
nr:retrovirus-related Pol polyprotein from transposon TNT 1-94 [Tanacetum cinerariifolium]